MKNFYDAVVIGAGAAGLAAAEVIARSGHSVLVVDRELRTGGILNQCIHNGFGLHCFKEELTGPEFAERISDDALRSGAEFKLNTTVNTVSKNGDGTFTVQTISADDGVCDITARAVMLATGCRERTRGAINTPGTRAAGVYTAGAAQKLLNREGKLPGTSAVIVGSGDIGLIMARRLRWCGIEVKAVVEIMPFASGLTRNVVQCLHDFDIPLYLAHSVTRICGKGRVTGVDVAPVADGQPVRDKTFHIDCDTVLFAVGLVPDMSLAEKLGISIDPVTSGACVDADYQTDVPGVFSAGNVLHVHDLVDFVALEAARAGKALVRYIRGEVNPAKCEIVTTGNLRYCVPSTYFPGRTSVFSFRPSQTGSNGTLTASIGGVEICRKKLPFIHPAEMITVEIAGEKLTPGKLEFNLISE